MILTNLHGIASAVIRRAERQGYVVPREIRAELAQAGLPEDRWKEVVDLARESLNYRSGRYYFIQTVSPRLQEQQSQREAIQAAVQLLLEQHKDRAAPDDRRQTERVNFIQQVQVLTEDGRELTLLSRDLSPTGIRLIGSRSLLGQKVRVLLPQPGGQKCALLLRVLWTGAVGENLFENGGTFLGMASPKPFEPQAPA